MARYTKLNSKYILAKRHQTINQGTLYERDWTTIGNVHRLEPGKRPYYGSGNFLFTENVVPSYKKKRKTGKWVGEYTYDDVKDVNEIVNIITLNTDSENLSDYAYWGSMTELFRGSVEHIVRTFPGRLRSTKRKLAIHHHSSSENGGVEYWTEAPGYILNNPFNLNMHSEFDDVSDEDYGTGYKESITYYDIHSDAEDREQYDCEGRYFKLGYIIIFSRTYTFIVDIYSADGEIVYCYRDNTETVEFVISYYSGLPSSNQQNINVPSSVTRIQTNPEEYEIPDEFSIHPNDEAIDDYFHNLSGFEWKLLNRRTKPLYQNTFLYPSQSTNGNWSLIRRKYTWPSEGYCIDIESTDYDTFINNMIALCDVYDNLWCDSIWRCMVHESVKNFDWSYRREYDDNDAEENIEGGNRMKDVMRLYGIIYDTTKRYVDGIGMYNNVSYDGYNNCPSAQISDRNILSGWDITSTEHQFYWYEVVFPKPDVDNIVSLPAVPIDIDDDSPDYIAITCSDVVDATFYKKNTLPFSDIELDEEFFNTNVEKLSGVDWMSQI